MFSAPSEPPHNVQVQATAPGELLVKWQVKHLSFVYLQLISLTRAVKQYLFTTTS